MNQQRKLELLQQQIDDANGGTPEDFDQWRNKTDVVLRATIGIGSPLYDKFGNVRYSLSMWTTDTPRSAFDRAQAGGVRAAISLLEAAKTEVELSETPVDDAPVPIHRHTGADIFIVHGRDVAREQGVARTVSRLTGLEPVILHEQVNAGQTIIEKLEAAANSAGYAIVIATGDDLGKLNDDQAELCPRARQNVIFELGYFFGKLGRSRVALLFESGLERPADTDGLVYIELDLYDGWKSKLASELHRAGYDVDWSKLGA